MNERILELHRQGKSLREIAKEVGISHVGVKKRLDRIDKQAVNQKVNTQKISLKEYCNRTAEIMSGIEWRRVPTEDLNEVSPALKEIKGAIERLFTLIEYRKAQGI